MRSTGWTCRIRNEKKKKKTAGFVDGNLVLDFYENSNLESCIRC